jgi:hypothetical protein
MLLDTAPDLRAKYEVHCCARNLCFILQFESEGAVDTCVESLAYCLSLDGMCVYEVIAPGKTKFLYARDGLS